MKPSYHIALKFRNTLLPFMRNTNTFNLDQCSFLQTPIFRSKIKLPQTGANPSCNFWNNFITLHSKMLGVYPKWDPPIILLFPLCIALGRKTNNFNLDHLFITSDPHTLVSIQGRLKQVPTHPVTSETISSSYIQINCREPQMKPSHHIALIFRNTLLPFMRKTNTFNLGQCSFLQTPIFKSK